MNKLMVILVLIGLGTGYLIGQWELQRPKEPISYIVVQDITSGDFTLNYTKTPVRIRFARPDTSHLFPEEMCRQIVREEVQSMLIAFSSALSKEMGGGSWNRMLHQIVKEEIKLIMDILSPQDENRLYYDISDFANTADSNSLIECDFGDPIAVDSWVFVDGEILEKK